MKTLTTLAGLLITTLFLTAILAAPAMTAMPVVDPDPAASTSLQQNPVVGRDAAHAPAAPQPGTPQESRDYERRQAESPEVQDFTGGWHGVIAVILLIILIVLIVD